MLRVAERHELSMPVQKEILTTMTSSILWKGEREKNVTMKIFEA